MSCLAYLIDTGKRAIGTGKQRAEMASSVVVNGFFAGIRKHLHIKINTIMIRYPPLIRHRSPPFELLDLVKGTMALATSQTYCNIQHESMMIMIIVARSQIPVYKFTMRDYLGGE